MHHEGTLLPFVTHLANRHTKEIGFIPDTTYGQALEQGRLKIIKENGEPCGFILHGPARPDIRIYQTCVEPSCRRINHGRHLWLETMIEAIDANADALTWICAEDLEANAFWERISGPPLPIKVQREKNRRRLFAYRHVLPRGREIEAYLEDQFHNSTAYKIAKLQGIEEWLEQKVKARWRREHP